MNVRSEPGASRLYALVIGGGLCLLGVLGFFYDAGFDTGSGLASDYLAGTLLVNGWRNVLYLLTGFLALAFAARAARTVAFALGGLYLLLGVWGLIETERGIGDILGVLPLGDRDNVFHLIVGALGLAAGLMDSPRPKLKLPKRRKRKPGTGRKVAAKTGTKTKVKRPAKGKPDESGKPKSPIGGREARRRGREAPRPAADA